MTAADALRHCLPGWEITIINEHIAEAKNVDWLIALREWEGIWSCSVYIDTPALNDIEIAGAEGNHPIAVTEHAHSDALTMARYWVEKLEVPR